MKPHAKHTWMLIGLGAGVITLALFTIRYSSIGVRMDPIITGATSTDSQAVNLAFERSGKIVAVKYTVGEHVKAGDIIMQLSSADIKAKLAEAEAAVKVEEAELAELIATTQPKYSTALKIKLGAAEVEYARAEARLFTSLQSAYSSADDAIHSKVDTFFNNPRTDNPELKLEGSAVVKASIESGRVEVERRLTALSILMKNATTSNTTALSFRLKQDLGEIRLFLDNISFVINTSTSTSAKATLSEARTEVNTAITTIFAAEDKLKIADTARVAIDNELDRIQSGAINRTINLKKADLAQAQARVAVVLAELDATILKSPVDGVIVKQMAKLGEVIQASSPVVSVKSDS